MNDENPMMLFGYPVIIDDTDVGTTEHIELGLPPDWYWLPLCDADRASLDAQGLT